jgi:hypothetical protein
MRVELCMPPTNADGVPGAINVRHVRRLAICPRQREFVLVTLAHGRRRL